MNAPIAKHDTATSKGARLGRGLSAIFADADPAAPDRTGAPRTLPVAQIHPNARQPRRAFDKTALSELADSIREKGILQPLLVRPHPSLPNGYEIVAGERRWRAAQLAQLHEVPVIVRDIKDREAMEFALVENIQRADLSAMEEAETLQRLIADFGHSHDELGDSLGKSRAYITNMLRLNQLPDTVKDLMRQGTLTAGHARALLGSARPFELASEVITGGLSVRQTENLARMSQLERGGSTKGAGLAMPRAPRKGSAAIRAREAVAGRDADVVKLERDISTWLGLKVRLQQKQDGTGALTLEYHTLDQLEDVLKRLSAAPRD